jgi:hypothetical protein
MPVGVAPTDITLEHFKYNILAESTNVFGLAFYGSQSKLVKTAMEIAKKASEFLYKDLQDFIEMLPGIGNTISFFRNLDQCQQPTPGKEPCNVFGTVVAGVFMGLDLFTLGAASELKPLIVGGFKSLGKLLSYSRLTAKPIAFGVRVFEGAGSVARAFGERSAELLAQGVQKLDGFYTGVKEWFGSGWQKVKDCLATCGKDADTVFYNLKKVFSETSRKVAVKIEQYTAAIVDKFGLECALNVAREIINPATLMQLVDVAILFLGIDITEVQTKSRQTRAAVSTSGCAVDQLRVNMNPKNTALSPEAKARINKDYGGAVNNNVYEDIAEADWGKGSRSTKPKETSPHHITPKKEFDKARCLRPGNPAVDVCQGSRDILDRVGMNYNDGCNGAFLPYKKSSPIHTKYPNAQIYNRTDFHDLKYYSRLFDILKDAENAYDDPTLGLKKAAKKAKLCEELQVIGYRLLTNQFH